MMVPMAQTLPFRMVALLLIAALVIVAAAPARTEALEPTTILAIASAATAGIVLIAYLVVANMEGGKSAGGGRVAWLACAENDSCMPIAAETAAALMKPGATEVAPAAKGPDREGP
jgi:hypothetical protein